MYFWLRYPFVRLTVVFGTGLVLGSFMSSTVHIIPLLLGLLLLVGGTSMLTKKITGLLILTAVGLLGMIYTLLFNQLKWSSHFDHLAFVQYVAMVNESPTRSERGYNVTLEVTGVIEEDGWKASAGKVKAFLRTPVRYVDVLFVSKPPDPAEPPYNPHEFNYQEYLSNRNIFHSTFLNLTLNELPLSLTLTRP